MELTGWKPTLAAIASCQFVLRTDHSARLAFAHHRGA